MDIKFTNVLLKDIDAVKPQPALNFIPDWYRKEKSFISSKKGVIFPEGNTDATIKKCIPVFDSITSGYMLFTECDVVVSIIDGTQVFTYNTVMTIGEHAIEQADKHPLKKANRNYPKFISPWAIKTPKGYSCLFIAPMHRDLPFTVFPGIVDTDSYHGPVNFPFVINDPNWEGTILKGTPIVQVIPFKRDSWEIKYGNEKDFEIINKIINQLGTMFFNKYKRMFWSKKQYN